MKAVFFILSVLCLSIFFGCKGDNGVVANPYNKPEGKVLLFGSDGFLENDQSGATVTVKDSLLSTTTDSNGRWSMNLTEGWHTLIFSKDGYGVYQERVYFGEDNSGKTDYYASVELYKPADFIIDRVTKKDSTNKTAVFFEVMVKNVTGKRISIALFANSDSTKLTDSLKSIYQNELYGWQTFDVNSQTSIVTFSVSRFGPSSYKGQKIFIRAYPYVVGNNDLSNLYFEYFVGNDIDYRSVLPYFGKGVSPINSFIFGY